MLKKVETELEMIFNSPDKWEPKTTVADGYNTSYAEAGDPNAEPLILVHGGACEVGMGYSRWYPNIIPLGENFHVFAIDELGSGDTDRAAADSLGVEYVPVQAFDGIDDASHEAHVRLIQDSDVCVLTEVAFGTGNVRSLEALAEAPGIALATLKPISECDFTDGIATTLFERLAPVAAWSELESLVEGLPGIVQSTQNTQNIQEV